MKKNIIFDFGKVLVHFSPEYMTKQYVTDKQDAEKIAVAVFDRKFWDPLDDGSITDQEVIRGFCDMLPENLHEIATTVYQNWAYNLPFIDGMPELVKKLKKDGKKIFLLSNISIGFTEIYKNVDYLNDFFSLFDGLVFSGPLGIIKPGKEIFNHLLNTYNLRAEDCIFIDDSAINIKGAENVGIEGYLFDGDAEKLKNFLFSDNKKDV